MKADLRRVWGYLVKVAIRGESYFLPTIAGRKCYPFLMFTPIIPIAFLAFGYFNWGGYGVFWGAVSWGATTLTAFFWWWVFPKAVVLVDFIYRKIAGLLFRLFSRKPKLAEKFKNSRLKKFKDWLFQPIER